MGAAWAGREWALPCVKERGRPKSGPPKARGNWWGRGGRNGWEEKSKNGPLKYNISELALSRGMIKRVVENGTFATEEVMEQLRLDSAGVFQVRLKKDRQLRAEGLHDQEG